MLWNIKAILWHCCDCQTWNLNIFVEIQNQLVQNHWYKPMQKRNILAVDSLWSMPQPSRSKTYLCMCGCLRKRSSSVSYKPHYNACCTTTHSTELYTRIWKRVESIQNFKLSLFSSSYWIVIMIQRKIYSTLSFI